MLLAASAAVLVLAVVLVARAVERDGHFYAGPFLPAKLARRTTPAASSATAA